MGWAVGGPVEGRFIGYGVPAWCDHPDCDKTIHRGVYYACGDGCEFGGCGMFFCDAHMEYHPKAGQWCFACAYPGEPFEPKPEHPEWVEHVATDDSWARWRSENPETLAAWQAALA